MINKRAKKMITVVLLMISTTAFSSDGLKYGNKPNLSQTKMDADILNFYNKWKGDSEIEDVNTIKPDGDGYLAKYDEAGNNNPVFLIKGDATGNADEWKHYPESIRPKVASTSEATGYGMIVFALMANKDTNAQKYFDGLLNLYLRNKSAKKVKENGIERQLNTMSWMVPTKYTVNGVQPVRSGSATDGDMDIAYALLLADNQWGTVSNYANTNKTYKELAIDLIKDIRDYLISPETNRILMGDKFYDCTDGTWEATTLNKKFNHSSTRPSDWLVSHLRVFNTVVPSPKWGDAINEIYRTYHKVSGESGLVPDFVENKSGSPKPANKSVNTTLYDSNGSPYQSKVFLEHWKDDMYGSNACRVPWRIAIDYAHYGTINAEVILRKINTWSNALPKRKLRGGSNGLGWEEEHNNDWWMYKEFHTISEYPTNITSGYTLAGKPIASLYDERGNKIANPNWERIAPYIDNHFVTPIAFANFIDSAQILTKSWEAVAGNFGGNHIKKNGYTCYFGDSINLLNLLLISGNWFSPCGVRNYKNIRSGRWYEDIQDAIDQSQNNDTIEIYFLEKKKQGSFALIENKNGLTIQTAANAPHAIFYGISRYGSGITILNSRNITVKNVKLTGFVEALSTRDSSNIIIDNVVLEGGMGGTRAIIQGNNIEIKNCFFKGGSGHPSTVVLLAGVDNLKFHGNVIDNVWGTMPGISTIPIASRPNGLIEIYNNTIKNCSKAIDINNGQVIIKNVVMDNCKEYGIYNAGNSDVTLDYNLYYNVPTLTYGVSPGPNKVIGDPKLNIGTPFVDDYLSYTLKPGSRAIDSGISIPGITKETDGKADIGAKESVNAAAQTFEFIYNTEYLAGSRVTYNDKRYIANWNTKNEIPGTKAYPYSPWKEISNPYTISDDPFYWSTGSWWNYYNSSNAYSQMYNENGILRTDIYDGGINLWDVHVAKSIGVEKGSYYTVVFDAKTETSVKIQVHVSMNSAPYTAYSQYQEVELTSEMTEYSFTFRMDHSTDYNAKLVFDLGGEETPQDIWIDNVKVIKE